MATWTGEEPDLTESGREWPYYTSPTYVRGIMEPVRQNIEHQNIGATIDYEQRTINFYMVTDGVGSGITVEFPMVAEISDILTSIGRQLSGVEVDKFTANRERTVR